MSTTNALGEKENRIENDKKVDVTKRRNYVGDTRQRCGWEWEAQNSTATHFVPINNKMRIVIANLSLQCMIEAVYIVELVVSRIPLAL